ncbi:MAG: hypothetical protein CMF50_08530 [Legionellales bacterium]|nr:hypothetical protein [Legionellales bacterium]|tara:strand:+ start:55179 stop:57440 length:2262 start_codon:yes stop_codon:yes gene_type:complete
MTSASYAQRQYVTPLLLELYCNGNDTQNISEVLVDRENKLWVDKDTLHQCYLEPTPSQKQHYQQKDYYLLESKQGEKYKINTKESSLNIVTPLNSKSTQDFNLNRPSLVKIRPQMSGFYLNYDFTALREKLSDTNSVSGLTSFNYFNHYGVGQMDYLLQNNSDDNKAVRLDTNWTLDQPEKIASWRFGDSITSTDIWTGAVRFGGIQYATNFATQPNFVTFPLPSVKGQAVVPTSVDLYLNNQLLNSQSVNAGAFDIQGLPVITGAGNLVVQTKDITGKQTVIAVPYYASPTLLQKNLVDFSYELGAIREDYGLESNNYSDPLGVLTYKRGITNNFTAGLHSEILKDKQNIGLSGAYLLDDFAIVNTATAVSEHDGHTGGLMLAGIQRETTRYNLGIQAQSASKQFWQVGLMDDQLAPKFTIQSNASLISSCYGSVGVSYTNRIGRSEPNLAIATLSYSKNLAKRLYLNANILKQYGSTHNKEIFIALVYSPSPDYTASISASDDQLTGKQGTVQFSKNLPTNTGYGYNLSQSAGSNPQTQADVIAQSDYGQYQARYAHVNDTDNYEINTNGSVILFNQQVRAARRVTDSFALVNLPGQQNIPIYFSNQLITTTNRNGYAFIPNIRAYQENNISIHPDELPINTTIESAEEVVKPYYHSGVLVTFSVATTVNYEITLVSKNNKPVAPGSEVYIPALDKYFPVGYDGQVFIVADKPLSSIAGKVTTKHHQCRFNQSLDSLKQTNFLNIGLVRCG